MASGFEPAPGFPSCASNPTPEPAAPSASATEAAFHHRKIVMDRITSWARNAVEPGTIARDARNRTAATVVEFTKAAGSDAASPL